MMRTQTLTPARRRSPVTVGFCTRLAIASADPVMQGYRHLLDALSRYLRVVLLQVEPGQPLDLWALHRRGTDCLYVNLGEWGALPFLLREKERVPLSFLIMLDAVDWHKTLIEIAPLIREYDVVVAPSRYAKACLRRMWRKTPIIVIPHSLDLAAVRRALPRPRPSAARTLTHVSRFAAGKGLGDVIECLPYILRIVPEARLEVIGAWDPRGDPASRRLVARISALGLRERVRFLGFLTGKKKFRALARCDLLVNLSVAARETFGIINIEALACGVPVLCTRWSGFPEIIKEGAGGFLIDVARSRGRFRPRLDHFVAKAVAFLQDDAAIARMKRRARSQAARYDSKNHMPSLVSALAAAPASITDRWARISVLTCLDFPGVYQPGFRGLIKDSGWAKPYAAVLRASLEAVAGRPMSQAARKRKNRLHRRMFLYQKG